MGSDSHAHLSEIFVSAQGEGAFAGARHLFVRFSGCNIRCTYCDTPASLVREPTCRISYPGGDEIVRANPFSIDELADVVRRCCEEDPAVSMIALTGGEPMVQHEFINAWLDRRPPPVGCLLETNATILHGIERLAPRMAVVSADVKLPSNSGEEPFWERHGEFLRGCGATETYVKMPVSDDTRTDEVRRGARLVADCSPDAALYLQPLTDDRTGRWRIGRTRLLSLLGAARAEHERSVMLPQLHKLAGIR